MSKRKNPSSKEGQEVVNLLTTKNTANATNESNLNTKETSSEVQANAKTKEPNSMSVDSVNTKNNQQGGFTQESTSEKESTSNPLTPSIVITQQMKDLDMTMQKATEAVLAGQKEEAAFLFRIHEQMKNLPLIKSISEKPTRQKETIIIDEDKLKPPNNTKINPSKSHEVVKEARVENGFTFREGASTNTDSNVANWLEAHKENVENIRQTECWMVAFRYNLKMRTLLFTKKVTYEDGSTGPIDISKERVKVKEICFAKARKCDELSFTDNPYAEGGERFEWDHNTGTQKNRQNISRNSSYNSNYSNNSSYRNSNNSSIHANHRNSNSNYNMNNENNNHLKQPNMMNNQKIQIENKKRKGYTGNNFDPNYVRKEKGTKQPLASTSKQ
ncbi:uncharacterized protein MELLADRAFT_111479 [Melampsora larici-populina 98AG31]|uniref:Uncharacterized protein n=1 Tax=Melampsora larici-populina (strain 98AG31 / pathotype 3-4-7) TaxID=747676 RepID=F4S3B2_MELLP|nr:uncharacterized protein MELLADRAFT_111479 [Melampsora larici-populina 98AG31]EGG00871.1 hypothetical protein MELLADRAFT_111479 [Melampsora larici-populina 98AG31]